MNTQNENAPLSHLTHAVIHYEDDNRTFIGTTHSGSRQECDRYVSEAFDAGCTQRIEVVRHIEADARKVAMEIDEGAYTLDWYLNGLGRRNAIVPFERDCAIYGYDAEEYKSLINSFLGGKYNIR